MWIPKLLLVVYVVAALEAAANRNWPKCVYWLGALLIVGAVDWMQ